MDISVVIPVYNNATSLTELVERICITLSSFEFEIILIDDCSRDDSLEVIQKLSVRSKQIKCHSFSKNKGQQRATLEGIKLASGHKIVVMDADLQDNPELISLLISKSTSKEIAVYVKRKGMYQSRERMFTSILIKKIIQLLSGLHFKAGSYYLFDKTIKEEIIEIGSKCRYPYMSIITAHISSNLEYVESSRNKNIGDSGYTFSKRLKAAGMAVFCSLYCNYFKLKPV